MKEIFNKSEDTSKKDESIVKEHLESFGLSVKKIDSKNSKSKSPDFGVEGVNGFYFYCEVKSIISDTNEAILHNTRLNKIERKIIDSYDKFLVVNKNHFVPNVLYFLANDFRIHFKSLEEYFRGYVDVFSAKINTRKHRDGKAYDAVRNIDLFIWFTDKNCVQYLFNRLDDRFVNKFIRIFQIKNLNDLIRL